MDIRNIDELLGRFSDELFVVPKGVEHCPKADEEVSAMLIEPRGVVNTGSAGGSLTAVVETLG